MVDILNQSLQQLMTDVHKNNLLLPSLQRKYTWKAKQIEPLFDSLMQRYPINTVMLWEVDDLAKTKLDFYRFLDANYQSDVSENVLLTSGEKDIEGRHQIVIDGQQRLTSLYIAFYGTYDGKYLCLRLDKAASLEDDRGMKYDFRFLSDKDLSSFGRKGERWMKVTEVVRRDFKRHKCERDHDVLDQPFEDFAVDAIEQLDKVFRETKLSSFVIKDCDDLDSVLDIFVRTNSGGKPLTKGDLLLSSLTTSWANSGDSNARDFVEYLIKRVKDETGFVIPTNDWVLKCFVFLKGGALTMSVSSFQKEGISEFVKENKQDIEDSIAKAFEIVMGFGLLEKGLTTKLAVMPIVYYVFKNKLQKEVFSDTQNKDSFEAMRKFVFCSILNNLFDKQTDNTLREIRSAFSEKKDKVFPCQAIFDKIEDLALTEDNFATLFKTRKSKAFPLLNILYALDGRPLNPSIGYDVDHTHPKAECLKKGLDKEKYDSVLNLNLMESSKNRSKSDKEFQAWISLKNEDERRRWKENNLVPLDSPMDIASFPEFIRMREDLFSKVLTKLI